MTFLAMILRLFKLHTQHVAFGAENKSVECVAPCGSVMLHENGIRGSGFPDREPGHGNRAPLSLGAGRYPVVGGGPALDAAPRRPPNRAIAYATRRAQPHYWTASGLPPARNLTSSLSHF
jgi:hypothetical protein